MAEAQGSFLEQMGPQARAELGQSAEQAGRQPLTGDELRDIIAQLSPPPIQTGPQTAPSRPGSRLQSLPNIGGAVRGVGSRIGGWFRGENVRSLEERTRLVVSEDADQAAVEVIDEGYYELPDGTRMLEGEMGRHASGRTPWEDLLNQLNRDNRSKWEKFTSFHPRIFGKTSEKSMGDLLKEAGAHTALGILIRIGVGTAGVGGIPLAIVAGAGVKGIPEYYRRTNETWVRLKAEHGGNLGKGDRLKGFFNPDNKTSIALAVGKGATFGLIGNEIGSALSQLPQLGIVKTVSEALGARLVGAVGAVKGVLPEVSIRPEAEVIKEPEVQPQVPPPAKTGISSPDAWKLQVEGGTLGAQPAFIEAGPNSPEIKLPENAQEWVRNANDIHQEYGIMKQAEVGKLLPKIDEFLASQGFTTSNTDPITYETMRDQLIGVAEAKVNEVYDSNLQEAVTNNMTLNHVHDRWNENFTSWAEDGMKSDLAESLESLQESTVQLENAASNPAYLESNQFPPVAAGETFDSYFKWSDNTYDWWKQNARSYGAFLGVNYEDFSEGWKKAYPDSPLPVHLGEIRYLVETYLNGGSDSIEALEKLKPMLKGLSSGEQLKRLNAIGIREVWSILEKMK